jgi:hypothetical protein
MALVNCGEANPGKEERIKFDCVDWQGIYSSRPSPVTCNNLECDTKLVCLQLFIGRKFMLTLCEH